MLHYVKMWKTTGGGCAWPDTIPLTVVSDKILCDEAARIERTQGVLNAGRTCPQWHDLSENKEFEVEGTLLRAYRAGRGEPKSRKNDLPTGGWLMSVCPIPTNQNNMIETDQGVCAPKHRAFMNQTRRGTGTERHVK
jgi:hypothetical protein